MIDKLFGHSAIVGTACYAHLYIEHDANVIERLGKFFEPSVA